MFSASVFFITVEQETPASVTVFGVWFYCLTRTLAMLPDQLNFFLAFKGKKD